MNSYSWLGTKFKFKGLLLRLVMPLGFLRRQIRCLKEWTSWWQNEEVGKSLLKSHHETGQNCQKQPFQGFISQPKVNKLRSTYSWKTAEL